MNSQKRPEEAATFSRSAMRAFMALAQPPKKAEVAINKVARKKYDLLDMNGPPSPTPARRVLGSLELFDEFLKIVPSLFEAVKHVKARTAWRE